jgi:KGK domain
MGGNSRHQLVLSSQIILENFMYDRFEPLNSGEVVSVQNDTQVLSGHRTFRVGELSDAIKAQVASAIAGWSEEKNGWFSPEGIDCEALRFGANGWQKGKIRLCLEFCPDEATASAHHSTSANIAAASVSVPLSEQPAPPIYHIESAAQAQSHSQSSEHLSTAFTNNTPNSMALPAIGVAAVGVATAAAIATEAPIGATSEHQMPPIADAVLDEEDQLDSKPIHSESFDEIAFDFDRSQDNRGTMGSIGMMELDLTDLGLDLTDRDLLDFEANGTLDDQHEFINLQDIDDRPENSGMLIDEVWNEMSQPNWPVIN